ncbi:MAG: hypothetical protein L3J35_00405 [Bacteroidales bacterium]|nr:hypothetical protein [Bacteroidales bacterium]
MNKTILITLMSILIFGCSTGKYVSDYKQIKKSIDTLVVLLPMVIIDEVDFQGKRMADDKLEKDIREKIVNKTYDMLIQKYEIKENLYRKEYNDENIEDIRSLVMKIKNSPNPINNLFFPGTIFQNYEIKTDKCFLLIYLKGHYTLGVGPYGPPGILGDGVRIYLPPTRFADKEIGVLLFNENKEVLYYNFISSANDPRIKELLERDLMKVLKPIYYR